MHINDILDTTPEGVELIKSFEGFVDHWYQDAVGVWTIGYGTTEPIYRKLTGRTRQAGTKITEREAHRLLVGALITIFEPVVERAVRTDITPSMFSALVSFSYNVGPGNFNRSTLLKMVNAGRLKEAAEQFSRWTWATKPNGQRIQLPGLVRRRRAEQDLFLADGIPG